MVSQRNLVEEVTQELIAANKKLENDDLAENYHHELFIVPNFLPMIQSPNLIIWSTE